MSKRICSFEGCEKKHYGLGYCSAHYRQYSLGENLRPVVKHQSLEVRFWLRTDKLSDDECWRWKLAPHKQGYGMFWFGGKQYKAHRVSYELHYGKIPDGLVIDHKCRVRNCVNPKHLQAVTQKQNSENTGAYRDNSTKVRGVSKRPNGKYRARVGHNNKVVNIGDFNTIEAARVAVLEARLKLHTNNQIDRGNYEDTISGY